MDLLMRRNGRWCRSGRGLVVAAAMVIGGCQALLSDAEVDEDGAAVCDEYCRTIGETCDDSNLQYGSSQGCADVCQTLETGSPDAESGNSANCRLHYALEATEDPDTYCAAAGPGGGGVCGGTCESFCQIQDEVCTGDNRQYGTITECMSECAEFDDSVPFNADVIDGDSLACRLAHLTLAASSPDVHCSHILPDSSVCL